MPEEVILEKPAEETIAPNPFSDGAWKTEPTVLATDPVIKEKDEKIKETNPTSDKPNEPEKIPGASPEPIQNRPDEEKKDIKPATQDFKFANEESEKVFNLLKEGKKDEVLNILSEQKKLAEVDKLPPADIIKLSLQYNNKDFSQSDINDLFEERYVMPEAPVQEDTELDDEFEARVEKHKKEVEKVENRIKRDAKPAITELSKLAKEIVLPDIQTETTKAKEPTQEELEGLKKAKEFFFQDADNAAKSFNGYNTTFKDEEVEIKASYPVTEDEKKSITPLLESIYTDIPKFLSELGWSDKDGKVTPKLIEDLHLLQNRDKVFSKLVSEVGNKRHEASIKAIKNIDYGGKTKSNGDLGASPQELQNKMAQHFFSQ